MGDFKDRTAFLDALEELDRKIIRVMELLAESYDTADASARKKLVEEAETALKEAGAFAGEVNDALSQPFLNTLVEGDVLLYNFAVDNMLLIQRAILDHAEEIAQVDSDEVLREIAASKMTFEAKKRNYTNHALTKEYDRTVRLLFTMKQDSTFRSIVFSICRLLGPHKPLIFLVTASEVYLQNKLHPSVLLYIFKCMNIKDIPNTGDDEAAFAFGVDAIAEKTSKNPLKHRRYLKAIRKELAAE